MDYLDNFWLIKDNTDGEPDYVEDDESVYSIAFLARRVARYPSSNADFEALNTPQRRNG